MSMYKYPLNQNVLEAAKERIAWTLENLPGFVFHFQGEGFYHYAAFDGPRGPKNGKKIHLLFIDWEAQFTYTIQHVNNMIAQYADVIEQCWWVALPLTTQNALTQFYPEWQCWEPGNSGCASRPQARLPILITSISTSPA